MLRLPPPPGGAPAPAAVACRIRVRIANESLSRKLWGPFYDRVRCVCRADGGVVVRRVCWLRGRRYNSKRRHWRRTKLNI